MSGGDLDRLAAELSPLGGTAQIAAAIAGTPAGQVAVMSSFGAESAALLVLVADVDPALPVIVLDTGALFDETSAYIDVLTAHLGLTGVRRVGPDPAEAALADELWQTDPDRCCALRKVAPLERASLGYSVLIDGRRRAHGFGRERMPGAEVAGGVLKLSPLAAWDDAAVESAFAARALPRHPLLAQGYRSIGCWPCTRPVSPGEPARAGRWAGAAKTECGIHLRADAATPSS